ncbi:hypothetical protein [Thioflexithrix psekupsensis]|uniref:Uncharacterized protein n=1 Tax=Thioflexithrix psekupsensis TaxID=1570016 RepID=A0A251XAN2_9GAMM|nr:hypothetical protein [Thioflexithrix psekupsensis]OUD15031.1 hypothetical protein TPSD3_04860 [Thioflexithrix psekupsensis]
MNTRQSLALLLVGLLCWGQWAYAGGFGTSTPDDWLPELTLHQVGVPAEALSLPYRVERDRGLMGSLPPSDRRAHGVIYTREINENSRIDFLISGIRNDVPVDIFLAYSTRPGEFPMPVRVGEFRLDMPTMQIIAGVSAPPVNHYLQHDPTPIGRATAMTRAVTLTVWLSDLNAPQLQSNELFFQALALPAGSLDLKEAQASEVDHFLIERHQVRRLPPDFE